MQHSIHYGLGFSAEYLTDKEADDLWQNSFSTSKEINISLVPFTEGYDGKDWATVVLKDCGEIENAGKFSTWEALKKIASKEAIIDIPTKKLIKEELDKFNLGYLFDKVELIIFSKNY